MLASIVFRAVQAGLAVGLIVALAHQLWTVPLIREAEVYEHAADTRSAAPAHDHGDAHDHDHGDAWAPAEGCKLTCSMPLTSASMRSKSKSSASAPCRCSAGASG